MISREVSYRQPLGVIDGAAGEQRVEGVVGRNDKANRVHKKLSSDVEEDQEEVQGAESEHDIDFGYIGIGLEVIEDFVFPELRRDLLATRLIISPQRKMRRLPGEAIHQQQMLDGIARAQGHLSASWNAQLAIERPNIWRGRMGKNVCMLMRAVDDDEPPYQAGKWCSGHGLAKTSWTDAGGRVDLERDLVNAEC
jgi:hypothetical protein